jgi:hypothetical protein
VLLATERKTEDPTPAVYRSPDFESGTASMAVSSSTALPPADANGGREMAEDGVLETHPVGPAAFQTETAPWRFRPPWRKAGDSNATELPAHRLAGEPGALTGSPSVPPAGFEPALPAV